MKIPLVKGYQNAKFNNCLYPLSLAHYKVLDKIYDNLHREGKMEWVNRPSLFAYLVFVITCEVHRETKGHVVADLQHLNK